MIDFDRIDVWAGQLTQALAECVPPATLKAVANSAPECFEDALDTLFQDASRGAIVDRTLSWIRSNTLIGYHGTRLSEREARDIRINGLKPLNALARQERLVRALGRHHDWAAAAGRLDGELQRHGAKSAAGARLGQVHLTLSKAALVHDFNHYLTHGSEFDQHVAHALLGDEGVELLASDGSPFLVSAAVPGEHAIRAAHMHFSVEELLARGDLPNLVRPLLRAWALKLARPSWQSSALRIDCGMRFDHLVPVEWIVAVEELNE